MYVSEHLQTVISNYALNKYIGTSHNLFNVGFQTIEEDGNAVKPLAPFSKDPQKIVYEPFIDYQTGEVKEGSHYFKPLSRTILQYVEHPENKFDGDIGVLERKYVHVDGVVYIGKEANNIDEQALKVKEAQRFINKEELKENILAFTSKQARKVGVGRSTLKSIKDRIKSGKEINLKTKAVRKICN